MATFGSTINPSLGRTDYSAIQQGANAAAQGILAGGQGIARGIESAGGAIAAGLKEYHVKKETKEMVQQITPTIQNWIKQNPKEAQAMGFTDPNDVKQINVGLKAAGGGDLRKGLQVTQDLLRQFEFKKIEEQRQQNEVAHYLAAQDAATVGIPLEQAAAYRGAKGTPSMGTMKFIQESELTRAQMDELRQRHAGRAQREAPSGYEWTPNGTLRKIPGGPADKRTEESSFEDEAKLRSEIQTHPSFKNYDIVKNFYERGKAVSNLETAAGDMSLIFSFMKVQDPTSVVREGEYATAENAASVPTKIRNTYNKIIDGQRLQPEQRKEYMGAMQSAAKTQFNQLQPVVKQYKKIAEGRKLNTGNVFNDSYLSWQDDEGASPNPTGVRVWNPVTGQFESP